MTSALPVTVVIPAYRCQDMVERAVRSALGQSRPPAEIIVVDDASGDQTGSRAAALGARLITHERNLGEGGARNTGIEAAGNDWVALLDCDDEWLPEHLGTLWGARNGHVLVGTATLVTGGGEDHRVWGWTGRRPLVLDNPSHVAVPQNKFDASSVLLRRDDVLAAGGFRDHARAADLDMWLRLLEHGSAVAIPTVTTLYHRHPAQISTDPGPMLSAQGDVVDALAHRPWCTGAVRRRHAGVRAWDNARAALAEGAPAGRTGLALARHLADPQRAIGAAQLLLARLSSRRLSSRYAAGGIPSVAVLPSSGIDPAAVPGAVDLRHRTLPGALARLMRRPTARAVVTGPATRLLVRAAGIQPIRARDLPA